MRGRADRESRLDARARRAELADVRHRLDVLTDRRLLADWTDDEAIQYAVLSMREHELLAQRRLPSLRPAPSRNVGAETWTVARRDA